MKALVKIIAAAILTTIVIAAPSARADLVSGYFRSDGLYVAPHYRTPANGNPYDNLSYRGYPSQEPGYISPRSYGLGSALDRPAKGGLRTMPYLGGSYEARELRFGN